MLSYSNIVSDASFSLATKFREKALLNSPSNATVLTMTSGTFGKPSSFNAHAIVALSLGIWGLPGTNSRTTTPQLCTCVYIHDDL